MKEGQKIKLLVYGALGRMGKMNVISCEKSDKLDLVAAVEKEGHHQLGEDIGEICGIGRKNIQVESDLDKALSKCDVVIDFTAPESTIKALEINRKHKKAFVIGTTGLSDEQNAFLKEVSAEFPIVYAPNFSIGVNVLFKLVEIASELLNLDLDYD
ncbi:MAG: 4-hydroxy-tetrahydrodipicolinate reductase, partial [Spirochaetota bacterium]